MTTKENMPAVIALTDEDQGAASDNARATAVAEVLSRRDQCPLLSLSSISADGLLLELAASSRLILRQLGERRFTVSYLPSTDAAREIRSGSSSVWPSPFMNRFVREIRTTPGALFHFADEVGDGRLEVFITDWSPCPAACAVAVHPQHPYAAGFADTAADVFTGKFVRHPLTRDLLPVWVAGWVKPDFGSGAVLVNPAHDNVDLAFGRRVGLPIRFALTENDEADPLPPVIKTGRAIRTGAWDGLPYLDASAAYFQELLKQDLAVRHDDTRLPMTDIAVLEPSADGAITVDPSTFRVVAPDEPGGRYHVRAGAALAAAAAIQAQSRVVVVASSRAQKTIFPTLVPLLIDAQIDSQAVVRVHALQPVEQTQFADHPLFGLAVSISARLDQPAVVRGQLIEQIERFLDQHLTIRRKWFGAKARMVDRDSFRTDEPKIATAFDSLDLVTAFRLTYALQKRLVSENNIDPKLLAAYLMSAQLLGVSDGLLSSRAGAVQPAAESRPITAAAGTG